MISGDSLLFPLFYLDQGRRGLWEHPELTEEEELAGRAISQIRDWMERESAVRGEGFVPSLAVKFCGGCNPTIERGILAEAIREAFAGMVRWVPWEEGPDLVLIINGCLTACADRTEAEKMAGASLLIQGNAVSGVEHNQ